MACATCGRTPTSILSKVLKPMLKQQNLPCDVTEEEIQTLKARLNCYKQKYRNNKLTNKYLGFILSMINLKDFCKYDIAEIEALLDGEEC